MRYMDQRREVPEHPEPARTLTHEIPHDLRRQVLFVAKEESLLFDGPDNGRWQRQFDIDARYGNDSAATRAEEAAAHAYASYWAGDLKALGPVRRAFEKITQYFERLVSFIKLRISRPWTVRVTLCAVKGEGSIADRPTGKKIALTGSTEKSRMSLQSKRKNRNNHCV
ncbi:hypothetical protein [Nisaea sp.]|uniref:hypothetical protein n=1 Tax=Nisaea sp. TaxID=2024842 RepID=UPI002B26BF68|nr:hypothetical protein [Nisaea sp.]